MSAFAWNIDMLMMFQPPNLLLYMLFVRNFADFAYRQQPLKAWVSVRDEDPEFHTLLFDLIV